jgi:hypothetical protein
MPEVRPVCKHPRTRLAQVVCANGTRHVMSQCVLCGGNALGAGRWVARDRVPVPVEALPVAKDYRRPPRRPEPGLFDGLE